MEFDFAQLSARDRYKLLVSVIVPRPIALVTSLSAEGHLNAAPFSFFNMMGNDPPLVVLGIGDTEISPKDSTCNIRDTGEFVINIVDEALAPQMNICAVNFPPQCDELEAAQLATIPSVHVSPPRIAASPVHLECRRHTIVEIGHTRIIVGEIVHLHIRDDLLDMEKLYVRTEKLQAIGRMHGAGWYTRTTDLFQMPRMTYEEWQQLQADQNA
jgi:flavin reductase (DIM6/NTAB) family NADH-FMN oxidoreductase RutF